MRPAGRIAAAIEVLSEVEGRHRPVAEAVKDWGLAHRFAGSGDRGAIMNLAFTGPLPAPLFSARSGRKVGSTQS